MLTCGTAVAQTPGATMKRTPLITAPLPYGRSMDRVEGVRIDFPPGQRGGLHLHPVPVVGYVTAGEIVFQVEGEAPRTLRAGDAFYEPADVKIARFDNASALTTASFVAFYLLGTDDRELVRMLPEG